MRLDHPLRTALALLLVYSASPVGAGSTDEPALAFRYRSPAETDLQKLRRTSILFGPTDLVVEPDEPERYEIAGVRVLDDTRAPGGGLLELCRSTAAKPGVCSHDFGESIVGQSLTFLVRVTDRGTSRVLNSARRFTTLRTHPRGRALAAGGALVEYAEGRSRPPDQVMRLVHVSQTDSTRSGRQAVLNLDRESFGARVHGFGEVQILSVLPPDPQAVCLVPLLWNVGPYLSYSDGVVRWSAEHSPMVRKIRGGFEDAARRGFDCDSLVVEFASSGRPLFGIFRLHPGASLSAEMQAENGQVLDALVRHLLRPPPQDWRGGAGGRAQVSWSSDFATVYHTLNDYLRGASARTSMLLLTDGSERPGSPRSFQSDLWPARLGQINAPWSGERLSEFLDALDVNNRWFDEQLSGFIRELDVDDPEADAKIATFLGQIDPGGLASLHPHSKDVWPVVDALVIPSGFGSGTRDRLGWLIRRGGRVWRMVDAGPDTSDRTAGRQDRTIAATLGDLGHRLRESYVVELLVPNPDQDGMMHEIQLRLREEFEPGDNGIPRRVRSTRGIELTYLPDYISSPPRADKMPVYMASPFKILRLLAAYDFREQPFDDRSSDRLRERLVAEWDEQVKAVLFESWVSVQFQRLQVGPEEVASRKRRRRHANEAYEKLVALVPQQQPHPVLAANAKRVALRYHASHPDRF